MPQRSQTSSKSSNKTSITSGASSQHQAPVATASPHSSTTSSIISRTSSSDALSNTQQDELLELLKAELEGVCYVSRTRDFIRHFGDTSSTVNYRTVVYGFLEELSTRKGTSSISRAELKTLGVDWPEPIVKHKKGDTKDEKMKEETPPEKCFYEPFSALLLSIQESVVAQARNEQKDFTEFSIYPYNKAMQDSPNDSPKLKPDLIMTAHTLDTAPWKAVELAIEVKNNDNDAMIQASSYARAMLASRPGRRYAICMTMNQNTKVAQYHVFSRGCLSSSIPLPLFKVYGLRNFIRITTAVLTMVGRGDDSSQDSQTMVIPGYLLEVTQNLATRVSVIGRASNVVEARVVRLIGEEERRNDGRIVQVKVDTTTLCEPEGAQDPVKSSSAPESRRSLRSDKASLKQATSKSNVSKSLSSSEKSDKSLQRQRAPANEVPMVPYKRTKLELCYHESMDPVNFVEVNETVVVKSSWPKASTSTVEEEVLTSTRGQWGLAEFLMAYEVLSANDPIIFVPTQAVKRETYDDKKKKMTAKEILEEEEDIKGPLIRSEDIKNSDSSALPTSRSSTPTIHSPPSRRNMRVVANTKGSSLIDTPDDQTVLQVIVDAIIGHFNCFKAGWLHGDVSSGNVLYVASGVKLERPTQITWSTCKGVLIDFDLAIKWTDGLQQPDVQSGTMPFISRRLLQKWSSGRPYYERFPCDDLESFAWLWLWTMLKKIEIDGKLSFMENKCLQRLVDGRNVDDAHGAKMTIVDHLKKAEKGFPEYPNCNYGLAIFCQWLNLCEERSMKLEERGGLLGSKEDQRPPEEVIEGELTETYLGIIELAMTLLEPSSLQL